MIPIAALAVAAGLAGLGYALVPAGSHPHVARTRAAGFAGMILAETRDGLLTLTDLRTGRVARLSKLGPLPTSPPPAVSADGKFVVAPAMGAVISLADPTRPAKIETALSFNVDSNPYLTSPFANRDTSLIVQATWHGVPVARARISVQSIATGRTVSLGIADRVAGGSRPVPSFPPPELGSSRRRARPCPIRGLNCGGPGGRPVFWRRLHGSATSSASGP